MLSVVQARQRPIWIECQFNLLGYQSYKGDCVRQVQLQLLSLLSLLSLLVVGSLKVVNKRILAKQLNVSGKSVRGLAGVMRGVIPFG